MSNVTKAETEIGATMPTKTICHVYAVSGNSIGAGTTQWNSGANALPAPMKAKYWDVIHSGVWRMNTQYMSGGVANKFDMKYVQKIYEPLYTAPEGDQDQYSSPMIIFPRLKELYSDGIHIAFCHVTHNGTGFRDTTVQNWNPAESNTTYNLTSILGKHLALTMRHMEAMGYDVRFKGVLNLGQGGVDIQDMSVNGYTKAQYKIDFESFVNYFRTTLGYTDCPFYNCETSQGDAYPTQEADWNAAMSEMHASLGGIYVHRGQNWWVLSDGVHPNGATGYLAWGEGSAVGEDKNMAELIYSVETT